MPAPSLPDLTFSVVRVAHRESRDIGNQVPRAGAKHSRLTRLRRDDCQSLQHADRYDLTVRGAWCRDHAGIAAGDEQFGFVPVLCSITSAALQPCLAKRH